MNVPNASRGGLIQTLPPGPIDIIGDVHGELAALEAVLSHLERLAANDRLRVFLGDLVDRGPDSPAVVRLVRQMVDDGRAHCILGNHELNLLLGKRKQGNRWFYGEAERSDDPISRVETRPAQTDEQESILSFFRSLPLGLARDDMRIVHACWREDAVSRAATATDTVTLYEDQRSQVKAYLNDSRITDDVECEQRLQNSNAVKVLTSGLEQRADAPYEAGGKIRQLRRVRWWDDYTDAVPVVFGHYSRPAGRVSHDDHHLFEDTDPFAPLGSGRTMCIDYAVGHRWRRRAKLPRGARPPGRLAALRWPEGELVFEDGERIPVPGWARA